MAKSVSRSRSRARARGCAGRISLCMAGEGAQALARQQVRMRGPVEQALVAVEAVARRRIVTPRHGVDEVERRLAAYEVFVGEAVILDNL